ncbi:MAG: ketopantoate reductase family protein [Gammaproteobacteria bacterium]
MRIVVIGAGGVGGYFGAKLARAGQDVTLVARGAHLDAIRNNGLRVHSAVEGEYTVPVTAVEKVTGPPADAVLLCVKSFDTETAVEQVRPVVGASTSVLSLQNGVDNEDKVDAVLSGSHALGGVAYVFASIEAPGVIAHAFAGRIVLGELDGRSTPRAEALREAFAAASVPVTLSDDIRRVLWEKYLLISAQAGMTALTRCPIGVIRETPETWRMYGLIVEELAALGRASGVGLPGDAVETTLSISGQLAPNLYSSLHHDLVHGKRLELEALHGHAVRLGQRLGVPTPLVSAVYAALKPFAEGTR